MRIALPPSAAKHRQMMPPQRPTPMSVLLCFECPLTGKPYRVFVIDGEPHYTLSDLPDELSRFISISAKEQRCIHDKGQWLDLVPEPMFWVPLIRAFPDRSHPFMVWHHDMVVPEIAAWRSEEIA